VSGETSLTLLMVLNRSSSSNQRDWPMRPIGLTCFLRAEPGCDREEARPITGVLAMALDSQPVRGRIRRDLRPLFRGRRDARKSRVECDGLILARHLPSVAGISGCLPYCIAGATSQSGLAALSPYLTACGQHSVVVVGERGNARLSTRLRQPVSSSACPKARKGCVGLLSKPAAMASGWRAGWRGVG
jgi:hypothetical protein